MSSGQELNMKMQFPVYEVTEHQILNIFKPINCTVIHRVMILCRRILPVFELNAQLFAIGVFPNHQSKTRFVATSPTKR